METASDLNLQNFYPPELKILSVDDTSDKEIVIRMKSTSTSCTCRKCGSLLTKHHGSHHRIAQDLPILGKRVRLDMQIFDYQCTSESCGSFASPETFDGFLNYNCRMTERLEDFICLLAIETSCEACARIMQTMNVKVSGDTVIRLLIRRYEQQPEFKCGSSIGIDDFAFKKRNTYGTIIVDEKTHNPVAVLEGRDGNSLKEWLRNNQHVTSVTRDRASAYSKAVSEVLPDCMQIADRFHLHQNLMEAVKKVLGREISATIAIPKEQENEQSLQNDPQKRDVSSDKKLTCEEKTSTPGNETGKKNAYGCG